MGDNATQSRRPKDDAFRQQRLPAWQPIMTPTKVIVMFLTIGICFVPTGVHLIAKSNNIYQSRITYDGSGSDVDCSITESDQGRVCSMTFAIDEDISGPLYVYYELENFYQNHRIYVSSRDPLQLQGNVRSKAELDIYCTSALENGTNIRNPCGLIAKSFFNDEISLTSGGTMDETGIAWDSDVEYKFGQVDGFQSAVVADASVTCAASGLPTDCKSYFDSDTSTFYNFWYPDDSTTDYLYEMFPNQISPIEGVEDEHFIVWMRTAALPKFRKLYGEVDQDFIVGDTLTFEVTANYEVDSFDGKKSIVISTTNEFGGKNPYLGVSYVVVGSVCLFLGVLFLLKQIIAPRPLADPSLIKW